MGFHTPLPQTPQLCWDFVPHPSYADLKTVQISYVISQTRWVCLSHCPVLSGKHCFLDIITTTDSNNLCSCFSNLPEPWGKGCDRCGPARDEQATASHSLHVDRLRFFWFLAIYCKEKILWWGSRWTLTSELRNLKKWEKVMLFKTWECFAPFISMSRGSRLKERG